MLESNLKIKTKHLAEMPNSDCLVIKINTQTLHKTEILTCWLPAEQAVRQQLKKTDLNTRI